MLHLYLRKTGFERTLETEAGKPYFDLPLYLIPCAHTSLPKGYVCLSAPGNCGAKEKLAELEGLIVKAGEVLPMEKWISDEKNQHHRTAEYVLMFNAETNKNAPSGRIANVVVIANGLYSLLEEAVSGEARLTKKRTGTTDPSTLMDKVKSFLRDFDDPGYFVHN